MKILIILTVTMAVFLLFACSGKKIVTEQPILTQVTTKPLTTASNEEVINETDSETTTAVTTLRPLIPPDHPSKSNFDATLTALRVALPEGKFYNHYEKEDTPLSVTDTPCTIYLHRRVWDGETQGYCNNYYSPVENTRQCHAYACELAYIIYGGDPIAWPKYYDISYLEQIRRGSIVRVLFPGGNHTIFITDVDGENITFTDANNDYYTCIIRWDVTKTIDELRNYFVYIMFPPINS